MEQRTYTEDPITIGILVCFDYYCVSFAYVSIWYSTRSVNIYKWRAPSHQNRMYKGAEVNANSRWL